MLSGLHRACTLTFGRVILRERALSAFSSGGLLYLGSAVDSQAASDKAEIILYAMLPKHSWWAFWLSSDPLSDFLRIQFKTLFGSNVGLPTDPMSDFLRIQCQTFFGSNLGLNSKAGSWCAFCLRILWDASAI